MPALDPGATLDLHGEFVIRPSVIQSPAPARVKTILGDRLRDIVGLEDFQEIAVRHFFTLCPPDLARPAESELDEILARY